MAQITVRAAARVLGLQHGQIVTYEETRLLRGLIGGGKLVDVTPSPAAPAAGPEAPQVAEAAEAADPAGDEGGPVDAEGEAASRAKHPAFRRRLAESG
jgi:hypothetical protein